MSRNRCPVCEQELRGGSDHVRAFVLAGHMIFEHELGRCFCGAGFHNWPGDLWPEELSKHLLDVGLDNIREHAVHGAMLAMRGAT